MRTSRVLLAFGLLVASASIVSGSHNDGGSHNDDDGEPHDQREPGLVSATPSVMKSNSSAERTK